jgi:hypothetical protein
MQPALGGLRKPMEIDMTRLTREQAVAQSSEAQVAASEAATAQFTNRVTDGTVDQGLTEFSGYASGPDCNVTCYYLIDSGAVEAAAEDLSVLDWVPSGYEVA